MKSNKDNPLHIGSTVKVFRKANELRRPMTKPEEILWNCLRNRRLDGIKFRRQHPILRFIADFYCHEARLIVEVDGKIHEDPHAIEHDAGRTYELSEENIKVIRFRNEEILGNLNNVLLQIHAEVQNRMPHARAASPPGPLSSREGG